MKIGIVGGTFNSDEGKESKIVLDICCAIFAHGITCKMWNGGNIDELIDSRNNFIRDCDVLLWMPLIDNTEDKILPFIKKDFPHLMLIQSKSLLDGEYNSFQLVKRLLDSHAALGLIISKPVDKLTFSLIDPLGNKWCNEVSIKDAVNVMMERLQFITSMTRVATQKTKKSEHFELETEFLEVVKSLGEQFSEHIMAANSNRFLGNASTRCCHGFPSIRTEHDIIYVSRRNVDKTIISSEEFVKINLSKSSGSLMFEGDYKPSVDAPVQAQLYQSYPNINYIVHGHVYINGAPFTKNSIPCGYIEEVNEIYEIIPPGSSVENFRVNLKGHGCLILANNIDYLSEHKFISRPIFEEQL